MTTASSPPIRSGAWALTQPRERPRPGADFGFIVDGLAIDEIRHGAGLP